MEASHGTGPVGIMVLVEGAKRIGYINTRNKNFAQAISCVILNGIK